MLRVHSPLVYSVMNCIDRLTEKIVVAILFPQYVE